MNVFVTVFVTVFVRFVSSWFAVIDQAKHLHQPLVYRRVPRDDRRMFYPEVAARQPRGPNRF